MLAKDIKKILITNLKDIPEAVIVEELPIENSISRIDLAVISNKLIGIEIKSQQDTIKRLKYQIDVYSKVCDLIDVVVEPKHLDKVTEVIPESVGIQVITENKLNRLRKPRSNHNIDVFSLTMFLRRSELIDLIQLKLTHEEIYKVKRWRAWELRNYIVNSLKYDIIHDYVLACLKQRYKNELKRRQSNIEIETRY